MPALKMRFLTIIMFTFVIVSLSACQTFEGAGRDIENAGEAVQDAAN